MESENVVNGHALDCFGHEESFRDGWSLKSVVNGPELGCFGHKKSFRDSWSLKSVVFSKFTAAELIFGLKISRET